MAFDLKIVGGTIVDGTGADRFVGDIAITGGRIAAIARHGRLDGEAATVIDATDRIVTPGFVDVHTHYDGQATWDELLEPSSLHGVTTVVTGNCGVGFAPVRPGYEARLIALMEGVEDIPGTALHEGMTWGWESFPEFLDVLDQRRWSVDIGTQIGHGPLRAYVMGERGARNEPARTDDIAQMARLVREALDAGALGFSSSRVDGHMSSDGEPVPGTFAADDELFGIARALHDANTGVFELAPTGIDGMRPDAASTELEWMRRLSIELGVPVTFALLQVFTRPNLWRQLMDESLAANQSGARLVPQIAARPFGMLVGFSSYHPFAKRPTFQALADRLPYPELIAALGDRAVRDTILSEADLPPRPKVPFDNMAGMFQHLLRRLYVLGDDPDYEPTEAASVLALGRRDPLGFVYDTMLARDGSTFLLMPFFNYADENHDAIREMLLHPAGISGLSDGGAHCRMICDASYPTTLLAHWARDRQRGPRLSLESVVRMQTRDTAELFGLTDRGVIAEGKRADLNVIDFAHLRLHHPRPAFDLPANGNRLMQDVTGYDATIVAGAITRRHGVDTGARPGRLIRGQR